MNSRLGCLGWQPGRRHRLQPIADTHPALMNPVSFEQYAAVIMEHSNDEMGEGVGVG